MDAAAAIRYRTDGRNHDGRFHIVGFQLKDKQRTGW
jgi:hypothetical protein